MNDEDVIATAYKAVCREMDRLAKVKAALEEAGARTRKAAGQSDGAHLPAHPATAKGKAPAGTLFEAIFTVLGKATKPLSNSEIRADLEAAGYDYSLSPLHVSKTLTKLAKKKKVIREGKHSGARYTLKR